jgi:hypothetical protein
VEHPPVELARLCGEAKKEMSSKSYSVIREIASPPKNPAECIFAKTTKTISADLTTQITPCQFGGKPDCHQCGCIASMGLAAVGHYKVLGPLTAGQIFMVSDRFGKGWANSKTPHHQSQSLLPHRHPSK